MIKSWKILGYDENGKAVDLKSRISKETSNMINADIGRIKIDTSNLDDFDGVTIDEIRTGIENIDWK